MSLDINELVRLVKRAAVEAVQAGAPMSGGYGYVTSTSPLEITVDQKKILTEAQLILTDAVRDYTVEMTTMPEFHETEETSGGEARYVKPRVAQWLGLCQNWLQDRFAELAAKK